MAEALLDPVILKQIVIKIDFSAMRQTVRLSNLKDGFYLYLMDSKNQVAIMERAAVREDGRPYSEDGYIGTHEGLSRVLGKTPVYAAGEFSIRDGEVRMVSNGSGTFRGGVENLAYAYETLRLLGLNVKNETITLDYSTQKIADPHGSVKSQVLDEIKIRSNPDLQALRERTRSVMKRIKFLESRQVINQIKQVAQNDSFYKNEMYQAMQFVGQWRAPLEGEATTILHFYQSVSPKSYERILELLSKIK